MDKKRWKVINAWDNGKIYPVPFDYNDLDLEGLRRDVGSYAIVVDLPDLFIRSWQATIPGQQSGYQIWYREP